MNSKPTDTTTSDRGHRFGGLLRCALVLVVVGHGGLAAAEDCYDWVGQQVGEAATAVEWCQKWLDNEATVTPYITYTMIGTTPAGPPSDHGLPAEMVCRYHYVYNPPYSVPPGNSMLGADANLIHSCKSFVNVKSIPQAQCESCKKNLVAHPLDPASGNMSHHEVDFTVPGSGLQFTRYYNSLDNPVLDGTLSAPTDLGVGWRHTYSRRVKARYDQPRYLFYKVDEENSSLYDTPAEACTSGFAEIQSHNTNWSGLTASYSGNTCTLSQSGTPVAVINVFRAQQPAFSTTLVGYDVTRDDGQVIAFTGSSSAATAPPGVSLRLQPTVSGFTLTDDDDNVETYNTSGVLQSITPRNGIVQTLTYDGASRLSTVTDPFGHSVTLAYDTNSRLTSVTEPNSGTVQFAFDTSGRLAGVTNADSSTRSYIYDSPNGSTLLTGIVDENSTRYATWTYDALSRAISSTEAGGADAVTFAFNSNGTLTMTDALGAARTVSFALYGDRRVVTGVSGSWCPTCTDGPATAYDASGYVSSRQDYNGNTTQYTYDDSRGLETLRTEASGTARARTIQTTWHSTFREPVSISIYAAGSATGTPLKTTGFTYDGSGNVLTRTETDPTVTPNIARTWTYTYDGFGHVLTANGPRTDVTDTTTYTYYTCTSGAECGQVHTVTDAAGHVTTFSTYNAFGQPLTISDPNGVVTTLAYDARQHLTSRTVGSEVTSFTYWPIGLLKRVTQPDSSYVQYTYDDAHRLTQITDGAANKISYTLDAMGNRTAENAYDPSNVLHRTHSRVVNTLNQLYQDINAAGTAGVTTTYAYDSNGNQTSIAAPLSRSTANQFDELNRLKQVTDPGSGVTQFAYDANDNLTSVTDPRSLATTYTYSGLGDLKQQVSPDTGTTTNTYDSAGNLATSTNARGAVASYAYDTLNRPTSVSYALGGVTDQTIAFAYDAGTDGKGHLTGASDANHSLAWAYDAFGRVTARSQTVGALTLSIGYGYTSADLTSLTTPSGQVIGYSYNANHQITAITVNGSALLASITYEPFGPVSGWTWGNSTTTARVFDTDGNAASIASAGSKSYSYDNASRITGITDGSNSALSWTYGYDGLDRLNSASKTALSQSFTYDANGNRLTQGGTVSSTFTVDTASNRLSSVSGGLTRTYSYDAAGDTTGYAGNTFTYNAAGRMVSAANSSGTTAYLYNAVGQRVRKSSVTAATNFAYDESGHLIGEYDDAGNLIQEIIWMGNTPVATVRLEIGGFSIFYIHTDHLNTPRRISRSSTADLVWSWESDPFGDTAPNENPSGLGSFSFNLRASGQYYDQETGLSYNYLRDYDPASGRYIESDPVGLAAGINTYGFELQNPLWYVDPLGLDVAICSRPADLPFPLNLFDHYWVKTGTYEAGMGGPEGNVPAQGGRSDRPYTQTQTVDHTGQSKAANAQCRVLHNVDEDCVNMLIKPGQPTGRWHPYNQCQSFAWSVVTKCRKGPEIPPRPVQPQMSTVNQTINDLLPRASAQ